MPGTCTAMAVVCGLLISAAAIAQDSSADYPHAFQKEALELFRTAISYRTAHGQSQVPALAEYLADRFRAGGFAAGDVHVLPVRMPDGDRTASLVVRYRGDGSSARKPILLLAHMDVVDARPEDWERDPFTLIEENGFFFGRGTWDDKVGVANLTSTFLRLKAEGFVPSRDLIIAFTGDEETNQVTVRRLVTEHRELVDAEFALNDDGGGGALSHDGKPVAYYVQTSEKMYATFELTVRNSGGHSSAPRADNAIYELATVLKRLEAFRFPVRINDTTRGYFEATARVTDGPVGEAMRRFARDPDDSSAADVLAREPNQVGVTRTTCVATMLRAGHADNALAQSATATVNCRIFPGESGDEVRATLARIAGDGVSISGSGDATPSPVSPLQDDVMAAVTAAVESRYPGTPVVPLMAPYATDGMVTRVAGIPTYGTMGVFIRPEDEFAHGLNERVPVRSFYEGLDHWYGILKRLGRPE